jgi:decaprenyl-phosphate phosphoribosyltransferase
MTAILVLRTMRPRQWVKNAFVAAPLVFSKHLGDPGAAGRAALAVGVFCALSGAVYAFNDVRDAAADRAHPTKRHRPIASGALGRRTALAVAAVLAASALIVAALLSPALLVVAVGYLVNNLLYTLWLKQIAFVDVASIAGGFLLRVAAGAYAIDVPMSPWLLACTGLLAGLLGFGKRAHELLAAERADRAPVATRVALAGYRITTLRLVLAVLGLATTAAYALYTRDPRTLAYFGSERLIFTVPFCVLGIGRFMVLALGASGDDSPTDAILRDWPFLAIMTAWGATVLWVIYGGA